MRERKKRVNWHGLCVTVIIIGLPLVLPCQAQGEGPDPILPIKWCTWIEPLTSATDPEWSPSDCFVPAWEKVQLSTELSNPDEDPEVDEIASTQHLTVSINMYKAACESLVSDLTFIQPRNVRAVDEQGSGLSTDDVSSPFRHYSAPRESLSSTMASRPPRLSLTFPMDPAEGYPSLLRELGLSFYALTAEYIQYIEVPFRASDQWIGILPEYQLRIEEAISEGKSYAYRMLFRYTGEGERPSSHISVREDEPLPKYWDMGLTFLNAEGKDVFKVAVPGSSGSSRGSSGSGEGHGVYSATGHGECGACGGVKTIQFKFAVNPAEVELSYVLNDIPVPTFSAPQTQRRRE